MASTSQRSREKSLRFGQRRWREERWVPSAPCFIQLRGWSHPLPAILAVYFHPLQKVGHYSLTKKSSKFVMYANRERNTERQAKCIEVYCFSVFLLHNILVGVTISLSLSPPPSLSFSPSLCLMCQSTHALHTWVCMYMHVDCNYYQNTFSYNLALLRTICLSHLTAGGSCSIRDSALVLAILKHGLQCDFSLV